MDLLINIYIYIFFPHGAEKESVQFLRNTIYQTPMKNENVCPRQSNLDSRSTSKAGWSIPNLVTRAFLPESSTLYEQVDCVSLYWSYGAFGTAQKHTWLLRPSAGSPLPCCGEARPQMSQLAANSSTASFGRPVSASLQTLEVDSPSASWDTAPPIPLTCHQSCTAVAKIIVAVKWGCQYLMFLVQ